MKEVYRLIDIIDTFIPGDWGDETYSSDSPVEVSCIRGADIVPISNNEYSNIPTRYISERSSKSRLLQEGDIVIEKSGGSPTQSTGRVVYITGALLKERGNVVCSNFCAAFRIKKDWWSKFVFHYLQYVYDAGVFFNFEGKTSGLKNLDIESAFKAIQIERIPREEQVKKANAITLIEAKMALNRSINANLEAMAKQLYDYWFVQFDFPDENGRPYKSSGGKMVWNEKLKREVPEGWAETKLEDILKLFDSKRIPLSKAQRDEIRGKGTYPYFGATCVMDYIDKYIFDGEYILLAEDGSTSNESGNPVIQRIWGKTWVNNHAHIIRHSGLNANNYVYQLLNMIPAKRIESGSIQKKISQENLLAYNVIYPPEQLILEYEAAMCKSWELYKMNTEQILELQKQRDDLLPLLMNGQVSITD